MAAAAVRGGLRLLEVTWTSDRPLQLLERLRDRWPQCQIGVGTVLSVEQLQASIAAGAQFGFSPVSDLNLIHQAAAVEFPFVAGALTPNEIWQTWQAGASAVKVFPATALGGPSYIRNLQGPLSAIPLIPTGGITVENATAFLAAGAIAVGIAGDLFPPALLAHQDWPAIEQRIAQLVQHLGKL